MSAFRILLEQGWWGGGGGGGNWSCKRFKVAVKLPLTANRQPALYKPDALPVIKPTASFIQAGCPSCHQTNSQLYTSRMPFLSPKQQYQSTEGRKYHIPRTCSPGVFHPCLPLETSGYLGGRLSSLSSGKTVTYAAYIAFCANADFRCQTCLIVALSFPLMCFRCTSQITLLPVRNRRVLIRRRALLQCRVFTAQRTCRLWNTRNISGCRYWPSSHRSWTPWSPRWPISIAAIRYELYGDLLFIYFNFILFIDSHRAAVIKTIIKVRPWDWNSWMWLVEVPSPWPATEYVEDSAFPCGSITNCLPVSSLLTLT